MNSLFESLIKLLKNLFDRFFKAAETTDSRKDLSNNSSDEITSNISEEEVEEETEEVEIPNDYNCTILDGQKCGAFLFSQEFCCSCPKEQSCEAKKKMFAKDIAIEQTDNLRFIDYGKSLNGVISFDSSTRQEQIDDLASSYSTLPVETIESIIDRNSYELAIQIFTKFTEEFYPNLSKYPVLAGWCLRYGISEKYKPLRDFVSKLNEIENIEIENQHHAAFFIFILTIYPQLVDLFAELAKDSAVFSLSELDFATLFTFILIVKDKELNVTDFMENNKLKRIGFGGEAVGEYGDTLWNKFMTLEYFGSEDELKEASRTLIDSSKETIETATEEFKKVLLYK
ncbi:MAG: hypothetical protein IKB86_03380 [Clostridia bacterium]|nr:hypothetical protein [Clostridia bacterium]